MSANNTKLKQCLTTFAVGTGTAIPLLFMTAATASFLPGGTNWQQWVLENYQNPLEQVRQRIADTSPILEQIMDRSLGDVWDDLVEQAGSNPPDPYEIRTVEREQSTEQSIDAGILSANPVVRQRDFSNLYDQEIARSMAAPVLGKTGQEWLEKETAQTSTLVESSEKGMEEATQLAESVQELSVTQDVMKKTAAVQSQIAALLGNQTRLEADNHLALLEMQRTQGVIAQLSANTSEGIDENNRRNRVERMAQIATSSRSPIYIPGLFGTNSKE